jgi:hypothetical protein
MVQIPTYGGPRVATAPLPGERVSPNAPPGAFGVPSEIPLGGLQQVSAAIFEDERKKANNSAVLGAASDLVRRHTELLYGPPGHPELGALNQHGENALAIPDQVQKDWQKSVNDISASKLHNDDQREAYARMVNDYGASLFEAVQRHVSNETQQLHDKNTADFVKNEQDSAAASYQDPKFVEASISRQIGALMDQGKRNGWSPDELKQNINDAKSKTYLRTLELMSAAHDVGTKDYFAAHRKDFQADDAVRAEALTKETTIRQQGFAEADRIVGVATDRVHAMNLAKDIKDPDVRDFAERQLQEHFNVLKQNEAEKLNANYIQAKRIIDQHPGVRDIRSIIPPSIYNDLTPEHARSLMEYAKGDVPLDVPTWLQFMDTASRTQELGTMDVATYNTRFRSKFDLQHQGIADAQWEAAHNAVANGKYDDPKLTEFVSDNQRVWLALRNNQLLSDPNKPFGKLNDADANMVNQFIDAAQRQVNSYEISTLGGKRKASPDEKQQIIDNMIGQRVFLDRPWRGDIEKVSALVKPDERGQSYVPLATIPPPSQELLKNLFKSRNQKIDQRTLERAYAAQLIDGRELMTQLMDLNSNLSKILVGSPITVPPPKPMGPQPIKRTQRQPGGAIGSALRVAGDYLVGGAVTRTLGDTTKNKKKP